MGVFLRKSVKFGPLRINLSKSGIGLSGGVKGVRISTGSRGTHLNLGRKGLYYRKQLSRHSHPSEGWFARLVAFFFGGKEEVQIERTLAELSPEQRIGEFTRHGDGPHSGREQSVQVFSPSLQPTKMLAAKPHVSYESYILPSIELLNEPPTNAQLSDEQLLDTATQLAERLKEFGHTGQIKHICPGPIFTTYEYQPDPGARYSRLMSLVDDLCLATKAESIDIERIPSTARVAIRLLNRQREIIYLRNVLQSRSFRESASKLTVGFGQTVDGLSYVADLATMPHLLIAGAPGMGKSVFLHSLILSLLYRARPDEVKFILMDSAGAEMSLYSDIPHLLAPIIKDAVLASSVLKWTLNEMERRYRELSAWSARSIDSHNAEIRRRNLNKEFDEQGEPWQPLPYIVICIDDLSDLLNSREVEDGITRLAQKGHASGIHLVLATQRPSVDVISGLIKASIASRMAFRVSSKVDSLTVINEPGAEKLLGHGDMLFMGPGLSRPVRMHGAHVDEVEIGRVVTAVKTQGIPLYEAVEIDDTDVVDELFEETLRICVEMGYASTSVLQRRLRIGYGRAAAILDTMESEGLIGATDGSTARPVLERAYAMVAEWDATNSPAGA